MGKSTLNVRIGAVPPTVKIDWVLAVVFKEVEDYNGLSVETIVYWGHGIETKSQTNEDFKESPIEDGKFLNGVLKRRLLQCHGCLTRGHARRSCLETENSESNKNENVEETEMCESQTEDFVKIDHVVVEAVDNGEAKGTEASKDSHRNGGETKDWVPESKKQENEG